MMKPHSEIIHLADSLKPILTEGEKARGHSIVYVMGITGDGKSTLMNYLNGTNYNSRHDRLGNLIPVFRQDVMKAQVCAVGTDIGTSCTKAPQVLSVEGMVHRYCDLPGIEDSAGKEDEIIGAFCPHIINQNAQSVQGIVWAVNIQHFTTSRAEYIKVMLGNLLALSRQKPDVIANALTVVVTRGNEHLRRDEVVTAFRDLITQNVITEPTQKALLTQIIDRLEVDVRSIVIADIFDITGDNRNAINAAVSRFKNPRPTSDFDFTAYSKQQVKFAARLEKAAAYYLQEVNCKKSYAPELATISAEIEKISADISCEIARKISDHDNLKSFNEEIEKTNTILLAEEMKHKELNASTDKESVGTFKRSVKREYGPEKEVVEWIKGKEKVATAALEKLKVQYKQGEYIGLRTERAKKRRYKMLGKPLLLGSTGFIDVEIKAPEVASVERHENDGVVLMPKTESYKSGYKCQLQFDKGKGCNVSIEGYVLTKNTPAGCKKLKELAESIEELKIKIDSLKAKRKTKKEELTLAQTSKITVLEAKKISLTNKQKQIISQVECRIAAIESNSALFRALADIAELLGANSRDSVVKDFCQQFIKTKSASTAQASDYNLFGKK